MTIQNGVPSTSPVDTDELNGLPNNSVDTGSQPTGKTKDLTYNREREIERKLDQTNKMLEESRRINEQLAQNAMRFNQPQVNENDLYLGLAKKYEILDEDGEPDIKVTKKLVGLMTDFAENVINPKFNKLEQESLKRNLPDYNVYEDEINNILGNELKNLAIPDKQKMDIAYEMAKGRVVKPNSSTTLLTKPNMSQSSVADVQTSQPKSGLSRDEMTQLKQQSEEYNIPLDKLIERKKKLKLGIKGI